MCSRRSHSSIPKRWKCSEKTKVCSRRSHSSIPKRWKCSENTNVCSRLRHSPIPTRWECSEETNSCSRLGHSPIPRLPSASSALERARERRANSSGNSRSADPETGASQSPERSKARKEFLNIDVFMYVCMYVCMWRLSRLGPSSIVFT